MATKNQEKPKEAKEEEDKKEEKLNEQEESKKETIKLLVALGVLAIICIGFFIWISWEKQQPPEFPTYEYNGFDFVQIEGLWHTEWQRGNNLYNIHLRFGPRESENVPIDILSEGDFNITDSVYMTFDPGEDLGYIALASTELSLNLYNAFGIKAVAACTKNSTEACYKRPIITCVNTDDKVIYLRPAETAKIIINENCMIIQGPGEEIVRAADKVIWIWYGIM